MTRISEAVECLEELGYTVTPPKPEVKLPTESGLYACASGSQDYLGAWHTDHHEFHYLNTGGEWVDLGWGGPLESDLLTKLEPVPVTAKKVLDAVISNMALTWIGADEFQQLEARAKRVAASFGVTG